MAVPAYATDLNDIFTDSSAAWGLISGGKQTDPETDDYIQGSNCWSHDPFSSGIEGGMYNSTETIATDDAVYVWIKADIAAAMATHAAGGMQICMGDTSPVVTPNYDAWYVRGSDDYQYGGWICIPVDPTTTPSTTVGSPSATRSWFGARWNIPGTGPNKGYPFKIDAMRHGRQIEITAGEVANPATWPLLAAHDSTTSRQWGICQPTNTGAAIQGLLYWGTAAASVYSRDSNQTIVINDTEFTIAAFTQILFAHASNDVEWDNVGVQALGTSNRGIIDVTANGTIKWTNSVFQGIDTTTLLSGCTFDGTKWLGTNAVTAPGSSMLNCKILAPTVAANTSALIWNVNTDPDGKLDGMEFSKGTNAHHAIEFGTAIADAASFTLRDCDFGTGFSATEGGTTGDETFHFLDTTGSITLNLVGCTGNFGYRTAGVTVSIIADPVTTSVTVNDNTGSPLLGARVILETSNGTGPLPYLETPTSITRSGTTATVTLTAHGIPTGKKAVIRGATDKLYNGVFTITSTGANTFTYVMSGTPAADATGTLKVSGVVLEGTTDSSGEISDSRTYSSAQPVKGRISKGTSSPYFKDAPLSGTVSTTLGLSLSAQLILDE